MCYDISFTVAIRVLSEYFPELIKDEQLQFNFEAVEHIVGHTYGAHPIIYKHRSEWKLHARLMEWGCIPFYVKDLKEFSSQRPKMLNARSERILNDTSSYWNKIRNRRCLVPVSGFYEHRAVRGWKKKVPYFITLPGQPMFFLPGLYSVSELPNRETGEIQKVFSFTIVTRSTLGNFKMHSIHNHGENKNRMPLLLPFDLSKKWVEDDNMSEQEYEEILNFQMPSERIEAVPVYSIRTPNGRPDGKRKNEFFEWPKLPPLGVGDPD